MFSEKTKIIKHMLSHNLIYPFPKAFSVHINGDHDHVSRYKSYSLTRNWVQ